MFGPDVVEVESDSALGHQESLVLGVVLLRESVSLLAEALERLMLSAAAVLTRLLFKHPAGSVALRQLGCECAVARRT